MHNQTNPTKTLINKYTRDLDVLATVTFLQTGMTSQTHVHYAKNYGRLIYTTEQSS